MSRRLWWTLVGLILVAGAGSLWLYDRLSRAVPGPQSASAEEHFLYGSIGTEADRGIPFWIWLVLPRIFPEYLPVPGGYASIGLLARDGREMPIGLSKVTIGIPRVGINCALCHTASVRATPTGVPVIYPGAAAHQAGAEAYTRFLVASASDPRFTAGTILGEIARNVELPLADRLLYRLVVIPETRRRLLQLGERDAASARSDPGAGRADLAARAARLRKRPAGEVRGPADSMPLWNLARRDGTGYLWDGSSVSLQETVRAEAVLEGASRRWMDSDTAAWDRAGANPPSSLRRVMDYLGALEPPAYPFAVDATLAAAGAATYAAACAACHDAGGARAGAAIPLAEIATDGRRLDAWTPEAIAALSAYGEGHHWTLSRFRRQDGYVAPPLDGVWLSAPYLHNGSVPTLVDLLEPPANRPTRFWRGYDVYDQARAGFVSTGTEAERVGTLFDVTEPGNGNGGHVYGTTLSADEKRALVEYLKTR